MRGVVAIAGRLALRWTTLYTRELPEELRDRRRGEIASDLWEHRRAAEAAGEPPLAVAVDIVLRVVRGMVADILWRRSTLRGRGAGSVLTGRLVVMLNRLIIAAGIVVTTFIGVYLVFNGFGIGFVEGGDPGERYPFYGIVEMVSGVLLLAGVVVGPRRPRTAVAAIALGAILVSVTHLWMLVLNVPGTAVIVAAAVWRMRVAARRGGPTTPAAPAPA